jgi:hypothetical protein
MEAVHIRTLAPLSHSDLCAQYLYDRFKMKLNARASDPIGVSRTPQLLPLMLPIPTASELDRIALTLTDAFNNRGECT